MIKALHQLSPFDPEHLPEEILLTEAFHRRFSDLPQIACFDTAFHQHMPRVARLLPIPLPSVLVSSIPVRSVKLDGPRNMTKAAKKWRVALVPR